MALKLGEENQNAFTEPGDESVDEKPSIEDTDEKTGLERFSDHPGSIKAPPTQSNEKEQSPNQPKQQKEKRELKPTEELFRFLSEYRFTRQDIGFTPKEVYLRDEEDNTPNEFEEEILDAVLFDGYYEREFKISEKGRFTLVTHTPETTRNCMMFLRKVQQEGKEGLQGLINAMMVARNLSRYMGQPTCGAEPGTAAFSTEEAVKARFNFCRNLSQSMLDAIGSRYNLFIQRTDQALLRNLSDF